jgi:hypothetical protein
MQPGYRCSVRSFWNVVTLGIVLLVVALLLG